MHWKYIIRKFPQRLDIFFLQPRAVWMHCPSFTHLELDPKRQIGSWWFQSLMGPEVIFLQDGKCFAITDPFCICWKGEAWSGKAQLCSTSSEHTSTRRLCVAPGRGAQKVLGRLFSQTMQLMWKGIEVTLSCVWRPREGVSLGGWISRRVLFFLTTNILSLWYSSLLF